MDPESRTYLCNCQNQSGTWQECRITIFVLTRFKICLTLIYLFYRKTYRSNRFYHEIIKIFIKKLRIYINIYLSTSECVWDLYICSAETPTGANRVNSKQGPVLWSNGIYESIFIILILYFILLYVITND